MRVLPSTLRRYRGYSTFKDLEQSLLNTFTGYIAGDGWILRFTGNFINFIDIDNPAFCFLHVIIGSLNQFEQNVLYIFTHITCFCKRCCIGNGERNIQNFSHSLGKKSLTGTSRSQKKNITLLKFYIFNFALSVYPFVVVVHRYREGFLSLILSNNILIKNVTNFTRFRNFLQIEFFLVPELLFHDFRAKLDTFITYINAWSGYKFAYLFL
ncbi:hypothetical protein D3C71_448180 [compost metagenome]